MVVAAWPKCRKCSEGELVPLSDYGTEGSSVTYKAWVCTNPICGFNIKIRNGDVVMNEPIANGSPIRDRLATSGDSRRCRAFMSCRHSDSR